MRPLAIAATVLTCAAANAAGAQSLSSLSSASSERALLNSAAFAPPAPSAYVDPIDRMMSREAYVPGAGPARWTTGEAPLAGNTQLRISVGGTLKAPGGLPLNPANGQFDASAYEVALTHDWPSALAFEGRGFGIDLTPHAGVGVTSVGGSAEAGATLRLMQRDANATARLKALGIRDGASSFGDKGRWYLFAAASGRAVGLNMLHGDQGWNRAGWTTDATSKLTGDAQVGVGWRKGAMQTSFGYIHREVKGQNMLFGVDPKSDSVVAFSLSIRPHL